MLKSKLSYFFSIAAAVMLVVLTNSCSNPSDEIKQKSTVLELINSQPNLSIYKTAIETAGLNSYLSATNYTYFVPTNAAFQQFLSDNNYSAITDVPVPILKQIMLNHLMIGLQKSTNLYTGYFSTLATGTASATNNLNIYVAFDSNSILLNGVSKIITADIIANDGILHIVDTVLILPNILTQLTANANFTSLLAALTLGNQSLPLNYFKNTLSDSNTKTFFAPTNAAFTSFNTEFGYTTTNTIALSLQDQILRYHIVTGTNYFLNSFVNNQTITTNQGASLLVQLSVNSIENYVKLQDTNNRQAAIVYKNIQCSNGMIHIIDKVLKP